MFRARLGAFCVCVAVAGVLWTGCGETPAFVPPIVPADLQFVLDNPGPLTISGNAEATQSATPVQNAGDLDGCWGRAYEATLVDIPATDSSPLAGQNQVTMQLFEVWRFNAAAQSVRYEILLQEGDIPVSLVQVMSGTFSVPASGSVSIDFTKFEANDGTTAELQDIAPPSDPNGLPVSTVRVELSGDRLFFVDKDKTAATSDPNDIWTLQRFVCQD